MHNLVSSQLLTSEPTGLESRFKASRFIGRPLKRKEDLKILAGRTRYVDDIKLPRMLHSAVLRSSYAHARIKSINIAGAIKSAGVRLVLTACDLPDQASFLSVFESENGSKIKRPVLASDEVR
ncbi:MAG: hypothetical protein ACRDF4_04855, partial [Rhabdochlamydiaceae bacterium]